MVDDAPFEQVVEQLKRGEEGVAARVYQRFAGRLFALAQARLNSSLRDKVDPEDVVQSAFRSFFALVRRPDQENGLVKVRNWNELWAVLVVIAVRKCRKQWRLFAAAGRDVHREQGRATTLDDRVSGWEVIDREPQPDEAAALADLVTGLMGRLASCDRAVLERRLQGHSIDEIVTLTGRSERAVYRVLAEARRHLKSMLESAV
jgi:DNA-directed RNA polymerase specialized sigma24 family protein